MASPLRRVLIAAGLLVLAGALYLTRLLRYGFSAHDEPSKLEATVARAFRHWSVPADLRSTKNPLAPSAEVLAEARAHFADHCASCHGNDGKGQTTLGRRLYPRAPDMAARSTQDLSDGELFAIIENGIRLTGMPGWGDGTAESARGSWGLVHLIRNLSRLSEADLRAMEKMNPMTADQFEQRKEEESFLEGDADSSKPKQPKHSSAHSH